MGPLFSFDAAAGWLLPASFGDKDSNLDSQIQSLASCH
jgi:hypothetical protein